MIYTFINIYICFSFGQNICIKIFLHVLLVWLCMWQRSIWFNLFRYWDKVALVLLNRLTSDLQYFCLLSTNLMLKLKRSKILPSLKCTTRWWIFTILTLLEGVWVIILTGGLFNRLAVEREKLWVHRGNKLLYLENSHFTFKRWKARRLTKWKTCHLTY